MAQINRLEKDLGPSLIECAERGGSMRPTPFGAEVAAAVRATTPPATERTPPVSEGSSPSSVL
ncbi:hypothetical protein [Streptomyces sp. WMMB 714]|uniref:hypothetical protein n=1 Tax=Streptomyces sp. WMMB 714 TaxID=1286822 RepID=UPI000942C51E|nr:hypothetical protein [Streptomyces sp. WMMB 714]